MKPMMEQPPVPVLSSARERDAATEFEGAKGRLMNAVAAMRSFLDQHLYTQSPEAKSLIAQLQHMTENTDMLLGIQENGIQITAETVPCDALFVRSGNQRLRFGIAPENPHMVLEQIIPPAPSSNGKNAHEEHRENFYIEIDPRTGALNLKRIDGKKMLSMDSDRALLHVNGKRRDHHPVIHAIQGKVRSAFEKTVECFMVGTGVLTEDDTEPTLQEQGLDAIPLSRLIHATNDIAEKLEAALKILERHLPAKAA